ncbi:MULTISPECIES: hypothetical protein [unclassified Streptomyces]|uniref:hypothetical protein n=1 Tax=unclassified Streptomyces TaxID=2593676 RepID=UPI0008884650|nr:MULTISPECIES: hypothetical protein [unclassified Streptomyces]PBC86977.1 hypothetical protein BX261_7101 [Streptomyces sp. 2321.6]SDQ65829.1 hypothetical protein SAMN05216511_0148 [Streptomyces sp. KS_16]SED33532.1 hypothetical protein SAMN05428954_0114 [Streptomyces sp. 2112.3]SEE15447.1 hypothetical protein SAMN05428940_7125 [Streptomyces sp. 2133.1]SNC74155.1 hypothetical protein SAMN06272741_7031 [Streptomyces sp. 2114.4]
MASSALAATGMAVLLSGCTQSGEPLSAGRTSAASAPVRLWPERKPAPQPERGTGENLPAAVPGVPPVPSGDIRKANLFTVVKAQTAAGSALGGGPQFDSATTRKINACAAEPERCPVRKPQYRDLTGDGKDELIVGIESPDRSLALWVFTLDHGQVTRIMDAGATPLSVEIANGDLILREPTGTPGYDTRTVYAWDARTRTMALRSMEFDQAHSATPAPERTP